MNNILEKKEERVMGDIYIASVTDFLTIIKALKKQYSNAVMFDNPIKANFIYRGMENKEYDLRPSIFRETQNDRVINKRYTEYSSELNILRQFIQEASVFLKEPIVNNYGKWAEIAQHYGAPTRFLDWTSNPLVALYFACDSNSSADAVVWLCHVENFYKVESNKNSDLVPNNRSNMEIINDLITHDGQKENKTILPQYPVMYLPYYRDARMTAQCSYFMVWGTNHNSLEEMITEENYMKCSKCPKGMSYTVYSEEKCVFKVYINHSDKQNIMRELDMMGINTKTLFPGLDGIGKYIERRYRFDYGELVNNW